MSPTPFASLPPGPCYAVIFSSTRTPGDQGYGRMADLMVEMAARQPGYLGIESARGADGFGITVSYWASREAIAAWRDVAEHRAAQQLGKERWYEHFELRTARVEDMRAKGTARSESDTRNTPRESSTDLATVARECMAAAYEGSLDFPTIVRTLIEAGFDGYHVDFSRGMATYHPVGHASVEVALAPTTSAATTPIAAAFDAAAIERAVREAQSKAPGYSFAGFCAKVMTAGCAGYMVSFSGRRVVYYGRTAEVHVEHFPK